METGLMVNFKDSNKYKVESFVEDSEFYAELIDGSTYLFPSPSSEFDMLEKALTYEFNRKGITSFEFESNY